jgi:hypothetical protein
VYGAVRLTTDQDLDGSFVCARGSADCRLTIADLGLASVPMPDTAASGSLAGHLWAAAMYWWAQTRALLGARLR